ncbi:unnamed protein product [Phaeothamnion confervicola]
MTATRTCSSRAHDLSMRKGRPSQRVRPSGGSADKPKPLSAKWLEVCQETDIKPGEGATKAIATKVQGKEFLFVLVRHADKVYAISESCGKCKFPLIDGTLVETEASQIKCPLCGQTFSLSSGKQGALLGPPGWMQGIVSGIMAKGEVNDIKAYETKVTLSGQVLVRIE